MPGFLSDAAVSWLLTELARTTLLVAALGAAAWLVLRLARITSPWLHRASCVAVLLVGWTFVRWPVEVAWYPAPPAPAIEQPPVEPDAAPRFTPPIDPALLSPPPEFGASTNLPQAPPAESPSKTAPEPLASDPAAPAPPTPTPLAAPAMAPSFPWLSFASAVWLAGMLVIPAIWLLGYLRFLRRLPAASDCADESNYAAEWSAELAAVCAEQGRGAPVGIRVTDELGPLLCRTPRGALLLVPRSLWRELAPHERRAILRHELEHLRRGDLWKSLAVRLLALPHWFNPAAWLAVRRFDEAAEWACDRAAIDGEPTTYAAMLLRLGELAGGQARFGSAMSNRPLTTRIRRLLTNRAAEDSAMKKSCLVSLLLFVVPLAAVRVNLVAQEAASEPVAVAEFPSAALAAAEPPPADSAQFAATAAEPTAVAVPDTAVRAAQRRMVEMAKKTYEAQDAAYKSGTVTLDQVFHWSTLWLSSELAIAESRDEQLAAAQRNLARLKAIEAGIRGLYESGSRGGEANSMYSASYHVADAERRLAEIEAMPKSQDESPASGALLRSKRPATSAGKHDQVPASTPYQGAVPTEATQIPKDPLRRPREFREGMPTFAKPKLLYDGKTFDEWLTELRTDLSRSRRTEALGALGAFAEAGYGPQVAKATFELMRNYSTYTLMVNDPESRLKEAALAAAQKVPADELLAEILAAMAADNVNTRLFAMRVLTMDEPKDQIVPMLLAALQDPSPQVVVLARANLARVDHDNPALVASLRQSLRSGQSHEIQDTLPIVVGQAFSPGPGGKRVSPYPKLIPDVVPLLDAQDPSVRASTRIALLNGDTSLVEPLEAFIAAGGPHAEAARTLLEEIQGQQVDRRR